MDTLTSAFYIFVAWLADLHWRAGFDFLGCVWLAFVVYCWARNNFIEHLCAALRKLPNHQSSGFTDAMQYFKR